MLNNYSWADTVWIKPIFNCKHVRFEWHHNTQLMVWPMYTCSSKLLFCSRTKLLLTISDYLWRQSAWLWRFWAKWNFTQNWMHQQNMLVLTPSLLPAELTNNTFCNHVDCAVNISVQNCTKDKLGFTVNTHFVSDRSLLCEHGNGESQSEVWHADDVFVLMHWVIVGNCPLDASK